MLFGLPNKAQSTLDFQLVAESTPKAGDFPALATHYPLLARERYRITHGEAVLWLDTVRYARPDGGERRALLYLADGESANDEGKRLRQDLWREAVEAIRQHTDESALFLTWWDNAQRLDVLTGRKSWSEEVARAAFASPEEKRLWETVAGPLSDEATRLRQLAVWLTMDARTALTEMEKVLPHGKPVYFLICLDDLARLGEIERLAGKKLGLEGRQFAPIHDLHQQIAMVKRWAGETDGGYLVQPLAELGLRAWRITDPAMANTLLIKLLPFTTSLAEPLAELETVYQSAWGGYLRLVRWRR